MVLALDNLEIKSQELISYMDIIVHHFVINQTSFSSSECPMSLSKHEMKIIDILGQKNHCTMSEIADFVTLAVSTLTGIIDSMVEKNFVSRERSEHDRRMVVVKLLPDGFKIFEAHRQVQKNISYGILTALEEEEQEQMLKLFEKITKKIEQGL